MSDPLQPTCSSPTPCCAAWAATSRQRAGLAELFRGLLDTSGFPRRWQCGRWTPGLGWLHIASDLAIFAAYVSIPLALLYFLARRKDIPFPRLIALFSAFILSCGVGHAIEALIFWHPVYRLAGLVKGITAVVSWATVVATVRILPDALALPDIARLNERLRREVDERLLVEEELRRSEAEARKLALVAARTDNAVILTDAGGRIEWVNDGFTRITGYEPGEVLGRTPGTVLQGPETDPATVALMRKRLRLGEGFQVEVLNYAKGGRAYWIAIEVQPIRDGDGRLVNFMAIEGDVTERRRAAEVLRASEERFALAVRGSNDGLWDWDVRTGAVYYSPRFKEALGYHDHEFADTIEAWRGALHPEDRERVLGALDGHFGRREPYDVEYRLRTRAGDDRWFHARGQAVWDAEGRATRMAGSISDITERKRIEQELRMLQAAVEHANDAILITEAEPIDRPGPRILYVNPAFTRVTGYTREEALGRTPRILQGPGTDRATLDLLRERLARWKPVQVELLNYAKDGREFWVELNIRPVADATGWYTHWVAVQRDITERRRAEEERRRRSEEALRESRERLRTVVTAAPVVLFALDATGAFTLAEGRGLAALGLGPDPVVGRSALEAFRDSPRAVADLRRALAGEAFESVAEVAGRAFDWRYTPRRAEDGSPAGAIVVATDITERVRAEGEVRELNVRLEQRLRRLDALRQIDVAISASLDLRLTLGVVLDQVLAQLRVDAATVLLANPHDQSLSYAAGKGFRTAAITATHQRLGEGHAGLAAMEQELVAIPDLSAAPPMLRAGLLEDEGFAAYYAAPLVAKGQVLGVLELYHRSVLDPDREWLAFLETLAGQAAIAVDNATLFRDLQRSHAGLIAAYDATIEGWARAIDLRDKETEGHTRRVTEMTLRLARAMGVDEAALVQIRRGALLHDVGKLGIPDAILLKPGPLTDEEWQVMRRHPEYAHEWLSAIAFLRPALEIPYCHHEKWDGTGYPRGLKGEEIPLSARIFAAVDIWDALRSGRPYREGWPEDRVRAHIAALAGTHLDPRVVAAFLEHA